MVFENLQYILSIFLTMVFETLNLSKSFIGVDIDG